jgi:Uma2 family endonuclease
MILHMDDMPRHSRAPKDAPAITGKQLERLPDLGRCELVRGRIVRASPTSPLHGKIEGNLHFHLRAFVEPRQLGTVLVGEVGIYTRRRPDTVRGADVLFISEARQGEHLQRKGFLEVAPDLVVEVLSPSDSRAEVDEKLREYFSRGVKLVWVADPERGDVRAYRSPEDVRTFGLDDALPGDDVLPGFSVPVRRLLRD